MLSSAFSKQNIENQFSLEKHKEEAQRNVCDRHTYGDGELARPWTRCERYNRPFTAPAFAMVSPVKPPISQSLTRPTVVVSSP